LRNPKGIQNCVEKHLQQAQQNFSITTQLIIEMSGGSRQLVPTRNTTTSDRTVNARRRAEAKLLKVALRERAKSKAFRRKKNRREIKQKVSKSV
jgi:hypothetical protein